MGIKGGPLPLFFHPASAAEHLLSLVALLPPAPPSGSSEIVACGPGRGRARAGLQGGCLRLQDPPVQSRAWWPPHLSGPPQGGVWACPRLPAGRILGGGRRKEGKLRKRRNKGRKEGLGGWTSSTLQLELKAGTSLVAPKGQSTR